jgi:CotH protein
VAQASIPLVSQLGENMLRNDERSAAGGGNMTVGLRGWGLEWACGLALVACGTNNTYYEEHIHIGGSADAGLPSTDEHEAAPESAPDAGGVRPAALGSSEGLTPIGGGLGVADAGVPPPSSGAPEADVVSSSFVIDVFGALGNRYWFEASEAQVEKMNAAYLGNGGYGDIYTPHGGAGDVTYVDHLLVTSGGEAPHTADFGQVQVRLVGQSTGRPWTGDTLPNFKIDSDEFIEGNRIGGVKHMRLNNAVVGSIFREKLTLDLYNALGYPAPLANYAWVSGSVWGPGVAVPYIAVESYKPQFCKLREAELGGGCVNMWEFYGDLGYGILGFDESCQFSECDATRALEFEDVAISTPPGEGYEAALEEWFDWDAFHRFQCLSWILETGDDALHNQNNFVLVERADGKFQHLPYSVDISLGQEWYPQVPLAGYNVISSGCQSDSQCWAETIAACEVLVDAFAAATPVERLDAIHTELDQAGMLREGDEGRYKSLRRHIEQRLIDLPAELDANRNGPDASVYCPYPLVQCGDACIYQEEECGVCLPPPVDPGEGGEGPAEGEAAPDAGVAAPGEQDPDEDPGAEEPPPPDIGGEACLPPVNLYEGAL